MPRLVFLCGTQGVGKTTLAHSWAQAGPNRLHIEVDLVRSSVRTESPKITAQALEDVVNWRTYVTAINGLRAGNAVCIDSTGASRRYGYLRQTLSDFPQTCVKLTAVDPIQMARLKWPNMGDEEIGFYIRSTETIRADYEIQVHVGAAANLEQFTDMVSKTPTL